jgi:hypothetical protein
MNSLYFKPELLLSGQVAPFTGEYCSMARARNVCFTVFGSGTPSINGTVSLQYRSPFFKNDFVTFYTFPVLSGVGYAPPAFLTTPVEEVRAVSTGTGIFWVAANVQN